MVTYAWRAGTSIWLIEKRATSSAAADAELGISGTPASSTFDGRCVTCAGPPPG